MHVKEPLVSDAAGLIVGAVIVGVAAVIWQPLIHITDRKRR
jgi:hypothetical protein